MLLLDEILISAKDEPTNILMEVYVPKIESCSEQGCFGGSKPERVATPGHLTHTTAHTIMEGQRLCLMKGRKWKNGREGRILRDDELLRSREERREK